MDPEEAKINYISREVGPKTFEQIQQELSHKQYIADRKAGIWKTRAKAVLVTIGLSVLAVLALRVIIELITYHG